MSKNFIERVSEIQTELKAPKNQRNNFGGYNYRNQEDILEAVKPLLQGLVLKLEDSIHETMSGRVYVKSTATITDGKESISNSALARESETQKGMSDSQITGSASSYARKYALNGLFLIDDTKDDDATNTHGKEDSKPAKQEKVADKKETTPAKKSFGNKKEAAKDKSQDNPAPAAESKQEDTPAETPKKRFGGFGSKVKQNAEVQ